MCPTSMEPSFGFIRRKIATPTALLSESLTIEKNEGSSLVASSVNHFWKLSNVSNGPYGRYF
jgi:hypothetical protein